MARRHRREQPVLMPKMRVEPGGNLVAAGDDAEIGPPLQQVAQDREAGVLAQLDLDAGPSGGEIGQRLGEIMTRRAAKSSSPRA